MGYQGYTVGWLQPIAWFGLTALAVPVLVHLLARQRARRLEFPTLRFLRATRLPALRRQLISDWPLLAVRMLALASVVAALATPVFVSSTRRAGWNARVARAIVLLPGRDAALDPFVQRERSEIFTSAVFSVVPDTADRNGAFGPDTSSVADALRSAVTWLDDQPPAARELVITGDLYEGSVRASDIDAISPFIGIRLLPTPRQSSLASAQLAAIGDTATQTHVPLELDVDVDALRTKVTYRADDASGRPAIEVSAAPDDQQRAVAILSAVLSEGLMLGRQADRRVLIVFDGSNDPRTRRLTQPARSAWMRGTLERLRELSGGEFEGMLVVLAGIRSTHTSAARLVAHVARTAFDDPLDALEPRPIAPATLTQWSRPSGPSPEEIAPQDEGDRRWFWAAALACLVLEHALRHQRATVSTDSHDASTSEARVA